MKSFLNFIILKSNHNLQQDYINSIKKNCMKIKAIIWKNFNTEIFQKSFKLKIIIRFLEIIQSMILLIKIVEFIKIDLITIIQNKFRKII